MLPSCLTIYVSIQRLPQVCLSARLEAVNAYFIAVEALMFELSMWRCSPQLAEYAGKIAARNSRDPAR